MKELIKKWWFWLISLGIIISIGITIIMVIALKMTTEGIHKVAYAIQSIDEGATVYSSAGNNTIIIELTSDASDVRQQVENEIKNFSEKDGELQHYSNLIIYIPFNYNTTSYLVKNVYKLPSMEQDISKEKIYIDTTGN